MNGNEGSSGNGQPTSRRETAFKRAHQRYRQHQDDGDGTDVAKILATEVIDFSNPTNKDIVHKDDIIPLHDYDNVLLGGDSSSYSTSTTVRCYGLKSKPGLFYFPSALPLELQLLIAHESLNSYCEAPHRTNLDILIQQQQEQQERHQNIDYSDKNVHEEVHSSGMWQKYRKEHYNENTRNENGHGGQKRKRHHHDYKGMKKPIEKSINKLAWSTLGYHYNWTQRSYTEDEKSPMPKLLESLSYKFVSIISKIKGCADDFSGTSFIPQAVIVNYYGEKCKHMGGHRDDLELTFDKPIISLSTGIPAIFLLGGDDRDDPVVPILIRKGDVLIMDGKCRLAYHGVARLVKQTELKKYDDSEEIVNSDFLENFMAEEGFEKCEEKKERFDILNYLETHRININIRQVLPDGVKSFSA